MPEPTLALFGFLANFVWEMWAVPFYAAFATLPHGHAVLICTQATAGDVLILLAAFWAAALVGRGRHWLARPRPLPLAVFLAVGLAATVVLEYRATTVLGRWTYADSMPVLPGLGTGLVPLVQWLLLPPAILLLTRTQLRGLAGTAPSIP